MNRFKNKVWVGASELGRHGRRETRETVKQRGGDEVKNSTEWVGSIVVEPVGSGMEWESSVSMVKEDQRSSEANL